ncbi:hypothetical protein [Paenibacillus xylaniclasticus]|uniref:hypothetical protein n=1 Tax=Paenibacillus xylaniclasticus TaxID=588083 RepID=UPI000FDC655D|nr:MULTISPECIES: hypothetical protein [Paenibacillus]GFN31567.1 hypothetical protein PCURB6_18270 [Paenibacillus curdlanolyticus]
MAMSINWYSAGATIFVLLITFALVGAMFLFVKLSTDDSERFKEFKEMIETIFGTPAHLRPSPPPDSSTANTQAGAAQSAASLEPFSEACPACGETVTEQHPSCPSCGLRLL